MEIDLNKDLLKRITLARKVMNDVVSARKPRDDEERKFMEFKRRNLSMILQEIGALVVLHYSPSATRKMEK